jgi:hypothetical protein
MAKELNIKMGDEEEQAFLRDCEESIRFDIRLSIDLFKKDLERLKTDLNPTKPISYEKKPTADKIQRALKDLNRKKERINIDLDSIYYVTWLRGEERPHKLTIILNKNEAKYYETVHEKSYKRKIHTFTGRELFPKPVLTCSRDWLEYWNELQTELGVFYKTYFGGSVIDLRLKDIRSKLKKKYLKGQKGEKLSKRKYHKLYKKSNKKIK